VVLSALAIIGLWAPLPPAGAAQGGVTIQAEYFRASRRPKEGLLPVWLLEDAIAARHAAR